MAFHFLPFQGKSTMFGCIPHYRPKFLVHNLIRKKEKQPTLLIAKARLQPNKLINNGDSDSECESLSSLSSLSDTSNYSDYNDNDEDVDSDSDTDSMNETIIVNQRTRELEQKMRIMKTPEPNKGTKDMPFPIYIVHAPGERLSLAATPSKPWFYRTTGPRANPTSLRNVSSDSHEAAAALISKKNANMRKAFEGKMTMKIQPRS